MDTFTNGSPLRVLGRPQSRGFHLETPQSKGFICLGRKSTWTSHSNLDLGQLGKWGLGGESALQGLHCPMSALQLPTSLEPSHVAGQDWAGMQLLKTSCPVPTAFHSILRGNQKELFFIKGFQPLGQPAAAQTRIPSLSGLGSPHSVTASFLPTTLNTAPVELPPLP